MGQHELEELRLFDSRLRDDVGDPPKVPAQSQIDLDAFEKAVLGDGSFSPSHETPAWAKDSMDDPIRSSRYPLMPTSIIGPDHLLIIVIGLMAMFGWMMIIARISGH